MDDLIAWLRVQLDEDERVTAGMEREMQRVKTAPIFQGHPPGWLTGVDIFVSPKRWQDEIEAKRRVLDEAESWHGRELPKGVHEGRDSNEVERDEAVRGALLGAVKMLALPLADRPGYLPEWRP